LDSYKLQLVTKDSPSSSVIWRQALKEGLNFNIGTDTASIFAFRITIQPNAPTFNNVIVKPMITTDLSATYDDFVAYSGDGELNENVASLYAGLESTDANLADVQSQIVNSGNIESGNTATSAHTVGTYIQWKGKFYVVTAAIAVGDTLAVGTNLAAKTVGDVLTQINADLTDIMQRTPDIIIDHEGLTLAQTMYRLMQVVDYTKLSFNSKIVIGASVFRIMSKAESYNQSLIFAKTEIFGNK
jgi:hypothetical protein